MWSAWLSTSAVDIDPTLMDAPPSLSPVYAMEGRGLTLCALCASPRVIARYPSGRRRDRGKRARLAAASFRRGLLFGDSDVDRAGGIQG